MCPNFGIARIFKLTSDVCIQMIATTRFFQFIMIKLLWATWWEKAYDVVLSVTLINQPFSGTSCLSKPSVSSILFVCEQRSSCKTARMLECFVQPFFSYFVFVIRMKNSYEFFTAYVTYSCEFFTCMWQIQMVKNKVQHSYVHGSCKNMHTYDSKMV